MTVPLPAARVAEPQNGTPARLAGSLLWLKAVAQSTRPRQWPKNLLVFAAPLAGDSFGRAFGFWYALIAAAAFVAASSAVYLVNDVVDAERDRGHPYKKFRPVAAGRLPVRHAVALAACLVIVALGTGAPAHAARRVGHDGPVLCTVGLHRAAREHALVAHGQLAGAGRRAGQVRSPDRAGDQQAGGGPDRPRPRDGGLRDRLAGVVRDRPLGVRSGKGAWAPPKEPYDA